MTEQLSALDLIRQRPAGSAIWSRESLDRMESWEIAWLVREESVRIAALGEAPEIEFRAGLVIRSRVGLIPVLVRVGPEQQESVYETWINHRADLRTLETLAEQPRLIVHLVGDAGDVDRSLSVSNSLAAFAARAIDELEHVHWSSPRFDAAREDFLRGYPAVWNLWCGLRRS